MILADYAIGRADRNLKRGERCATGGPGGCKAWTSGPRIEAIGPGATKTLPRLEIVAPAPEKRLRRRGFLGSTAPNVSGSVAVDCRGIRAIASELGTREKTVGLWRRRFAAHGTAGIERNAPGRGRPATVQRSAVEAEVIRKTTRERPPNATHWSTRTMAVEVGISPASVQRIWRRNGLKPHLVRTFKVSNDPNFVQKLEDIVGLYLNPPENALVFSIDEKSQIQALDRTQPGLPIKKGRAGTMTHDYKRHGTTTLFAVLCTLTGYVISTCMPRHRHQEWIKFLNLIDRDVPKDLDVHLICDNYATQNHEQVKRWLTRHRRFHVHFTPTSASWLNMVERFFRDITDKRLRRGVFHNVAELIDAIDEYIFHHNDHPKPFIWTKTASDILAKVMRARETLNNAPST